MTYVVLTCDIGSSNDESATNLVRFFLLLLHHHHHHLSHSLSLTLSLSLSLARALLHLHLQMSSMEPQRVVSSNRDWLRMLRRQLLLWGHSELE